MTDLPILDAPTRFRLVRELARGGMATVYEAEQVGPAEFSKRIAVKIIHARYGAHQDWRQLLIDEVVLAPTPDLVSRLPELDPAMQEIISAAIAKEPEDRPSAAALGRALDAWTAQRGAPGSPERLQAHLAELFPEAPVAPPQRQERASVSLLTGVHVPAR